jgi:hypothetical protein
MGWRAAVVLGAVLVGLTVPGCGGGGEGGEAGPTLRELIQRLGGWSDEATPLLHEVEDGSLAASRYRIAAAPVTAEQLSRISSGGHQAGEEARLSAEEFDRFTEQTFDEVKNVYCYAASQVSELDAPPSDPETFQEFMLGYLSSRLYSYTPRAELESIIGRFRDALTTAHDEGPVAAEVAMATVCG